MMQPFRDERGDQGDLDFFFADFAISVLPNQRAPLPNPPGLVLHSSESKVQLFPGSFRARW